MLIRGQEVVGKYQILQQVRDGYFFRIWLAEELTRGGRQVIIKEPLLDNNGDLAEEITYSLQQEIRIRSALDQVNAVGIVPILTFELYGDSLLLILRYMGGGNLAEMLTRSGRLPWMQAVHIAIDVLRSLQALHNHPWRIIHCDLTPSNILFDSVQRAYITDFAWSYISNATARDLVKLRKEQWHTTALYAAPELIAHRTPTPATDLYVVGCILFEMLGGQPYLEANPDSSLRSLSPDTPEWLEDIIAKATREAPHERWATAVEMIEAIEDGLAGAEAAQIIPILSFEDARPTQSSPKLAGPARLPLLASAVALFALIVSLGIWTHTEWKLAEHIQSQEHGTRIAAIIPTLVPTLDQMPAPQDLRPTILLSAEVPTPDPTGSGGSILISDGPSSTTTGPATIPALLSVTHEAGENFAPPIGALTEEPNAIPTDTDVVTVTSSPPTWDVNSNNAPNLLLPSVTTASTYELPTETITPVAIGAEATRDYSDPQSPVSLSVPSPTGALSSTASTTPTATTTTSSLSQAFWALQTLMATLSSAVAETPITTQLPVTPTAMFIRTPAATQQPISTQTPLPMPFALSVEFSATMPNLIVGYITAPTMTVSIPISLPVVAADEYEGLRLIITSTPPLLWRSEFTFDPPQGPMRWLSSTLSAEVTPGLAGFYTLSVKVDGTTKSGYRAGTDDAIEQQLLLCVPSRLQRDQNLWFYNPQGGAVAAYFREGEPVCIYDRDDCADNPGSTGYTASYHVWMLGNEPGISPGPDYWVVENFLPDREFTRLSEYTDILQLVDPSGRDCFK